MKAGAAAQRRAAENASHRIEGEAAGQSTQFSEGWGWKTGGRDREGSAAAPEEGHRRGAGDWGRGEDDERETPGGATADAIARCEGNRKVAAGTRRGGAAENAGVGIQGDALWKSAV